MSAIPFGVAFLVTADIGTGGVINDRYPDPFLSVGTPQIAQAFKVAAIADTGAGTVLAGACTGKVVVGVAVKEGEHELAILAYFPVGRNIGQELQVFSSLHLLCRQAKVNGATECEGEPFVQKAFTNIEVEVGAVNGQFVILVNIINQVAAIVQLGIEVYLNTFIVKQFLEDVGELFAQCAG